MVEFEYYTDTNESTVSYLYPLFQLYEHLFFDMI